MGVAIISAGGVVLAALIGLIVSVVGANERSSRLLREADALGKLERGTLAHKLLENYLEQSIAQYAWEVEHKSRFRSARTYLFWGMLVAFALTLWTVLRQYADVQRWDGAYWTIYWVLVLVALILIAMAANENIRILRQRRARNATRKKTDDE